MSYTGWSDEDLAQRNAEFGVRLNHVEADVLGALYRGHDDAAAIVAETGLSRGQVQHALSVLQAQGLATEQRREQASS